MSALTEAQKTLNGCRYRNGVFRLAHMVDDRLGVALDITVDDAFAPGETSSASKALPIEGTDAVAVTAAAFAVVLRHEQHEAAEFFTYNGVRPFDPHCGQ